MTWCQLLTRRALALVEPRGATPAAAQAATPVVPQEEEGVQKHRERLAAIAAAGQAGQYGLVVRWKTFAANQIDTLDNIEIEKLYARYEAGAGRGWGGGGGDDEDLGVCGAPALCGGGGHVSPNRKPARAYRRPRERPVCWTRA